MHNYKFIFFLPIISCFKTPINWSPESWKLKPISQDVFYENKQELNIVLDEIKKSAPLIFAGEVETLKTDIIKASKGEAFLLMGGDCAETFREFKTENIMNTYRVLLQMTMIFMYGMSKPVIKIGRMAGQFAKPRSDIYETINNITLYSYRGDIINNENFDEKSRIPNPNLMLKAYSQSAQTMNLIRALSEGGYANLERINDWNLNFVKNTITGKKYELFSNNINKALSFIKALGLEKIEESKRARFYTAHESLLLYYESSLTRKDSITNNYYSCSGHMLWIGERTREINGAHVEFASGIQNPIGIKISEKCNTNELESLIRKLNPDNEIGKIILIIRMGKNIEKSLPKLAYMIKQRKINVLWISDPMHGNTIKLNNGIKTRYLEDIKEEYTFFHNILKQYNLYPGGIHLEMTGRDVTECIYKNTNQNFIDNMKNNYESSCDPRLSAEQCLELAFYIISLE
jgi:3-deoxy-7-phosphoheptulonate synthase